MVKDKTRLREGRMEGEEGYRMTATIAIPVRRLRLYGGCPRIRAVSKRALIPVPWMNLKQKVQSNRMSFR